MSDMCNGSPADGMEETPNGIFENVPMESYPGLPNPVVVGPVFPGDKTVEISNTVLGAAVELWVIRDKGQDPRLLASQPGLLANDFFKLNISYIDLDLQAGDLLGAKQYLGTQSSTEMPFYLVQEAGLPRPFYVIGHNADNMQEALKALTMGANALGPDVNIFDDGRLSISHDPGTESDPDLISYLKYVNTLASEYPTLSLIIFDCKEPCQSADYGLKLLTAIRQYLTNDFPLISIIISIPSLAGVATFDKIAPMLRPREGLMIDEEDDARFVYKYFSDQGISNASYGHGDPDIYRPTVVPAVRRGVQQACGLKAGEEASNFKFVQVWTANIKALQREWLRIGVDGIITDASEPIDGPGLRNLLEVLQEPEFTPYLRFATREDNAMKLPNAAYEVKFHTDAESDAKTDSTVSFTLKGNNGVDGPLWSVNNRLQVDLENNVYGHVTYPSGDLGDLKSVTVWRTGDTSTSVLNGSYERATVRSSRWKVVQKIIDINQEVNDAAPVTSTLT